MSNRNRRLATLLAAAIVIALAVRDLRSDQSDIDLHGHENFSFALWGDTPYSDREKAAIPSLIEDINNAGVKFTVFDGDIKSGSSRCDDNVYTDAIARFNTFAAPMIYVPGDNEWTDCHRKNNGNFNPLERLAFIRNTMFATPESFGEKKLTLEHQDVGVVPGTSYPENTRWSYGEVVFLGLNVPGSNNNKVNPGQCIRSNTNRQQPECDLDNAEYAARDAANIQFLNESFDFAMMHNARGVVILIQADPSFDLPETESDNERTCVRAAQGECLDAPDNTNPNLANYDGYDAFLAALRQKTVEFGTVGGQVVLVHGDTHFYKVDKPLDTPTSLLPNFTRVCTFGSPSVDWIKVAVDHNSRNLFNFEPMIVQ
jgi:hypothetical protein